MGLFSFTQEIAMDLGTANTIIITNGKFIGNFHTVREREESIRSHYCTIQVETE